MYCRDFYNFGANQRHAELLKPVRFVFYMIIIAIPSMLCFLSFLTIFYRFTWCFHMFPLVFLLFFGFFYSFPSVFHPFSILDFAISEDVNLEH